MIRRAAATPTWEGWPLADLYGVAGSVDSSKRWTRTVSLPAESERRGYYCTVAWCSGAHAEKHEYCT